MFRKLRFLMIDDMLQAAEDGNYNCLKLGEREASVTEPRSDSVNRTTG